jgi:hypothetical protein
MIFTLIKMLLAVIIGVIYIPMNLLILKVSELYQTPSLRKKDPVLYWIVRIMIFPLWIVTAILSVPYEALVESAH